jgi:GPH family glycoside/pentoside/hexuronide:cation symporter
MFVICFATTKERVQPIKEENLNIACENSFRNDQWRILSVYNFMMLVAVVNYVNNNKVYSIMLGGMLAFFPIYNADCWRLTDVYGDARWARR